MVSDRVLKSVGLLSLLHQTDQYSNFKLFKDTTEFRNILFDCFTVGVEVAYLVECYAMCYQPIDILWENLYRIIITEKELRDQMVRCLYFKHNDTVQIKLLFLVSDLRRSNIYPSHNSGNPEYYWSTPPR